MLFNILEETSFNPVNTYLHYSVFSALLPYTQTSTLSSIQTDRGQTHSIRSCLKVSVHI